jgi:predicted component of type VI protein secretion system
VFDFGQSGPTRDEYEMFCGTQIALMSSAAVLDEAVRDLAKGNPVMLNGIKSPMTFLREHLQVERLPNNEFVSLRFTASSPNPAEVTGALRSICKAYLSASVDMHAAEHSEVHERLQEELQSRQVEIQALRNELIRLRQGEPETESSVQFVEVELKIEEDLYRLLSERRHQLRMISRDRSRASLVYAATIE